LHSTHYIIDWYLGVWKNEILLQWKKVEIGIYFPSVFLPTFKAITNPLKERHFWVNLIFFLCQTLTGNIKN
jgi:hypothetical protein